MLKLCFALFILGIFTFNSNAMVMSFSRLRPSNDEYFDVSNVKVSFKKSLKSSKNYFSQYEVIDQDVDPKVVSNPSRQVKTNVEDIKKTDLVSFLQDNNVKKLLLLLYYKKYGNLPGEFPTMPTAKNPCNRRSRFGNNCRSLI